jgi:hypothetical protein
MAAYLRDTDRLMFPAVAEAVAVLDLDPNGKDAAAVKLAKLYAIAIDEASDAKQANVLRWLGPELQKVLESLGATPAARAAMKKPAKPADAKPNGLARLRAAREA